MFADQTSFFHMADKFTRNPVGLRTQRARDAIITSSLRQHDVADVVRRRRRLDVVKTLFLRHYCVMCPLGMQDPDRCQIQLKRAPLFLRGIVMTLLWAPWRLKSQITRLFPPKCLQANNIESIPSLALTGRFPHKRSIMRKAILCHDVITALYTGPCWQESEQDPLLSLSYLTGGDVALAQGNT